MVTPFQVFQEYNHIPVTTLMGQREAVVRQYRNAGIAATLGVDWRLLAEDMEGYFRGSRNRPAPDAAASHASPDSRTFATHTRQGPRQAAFAPVGNTRVYLAFVGKLTPTDIKYFLEAFGHFWPHRQPALWARLGTGSEPPYKALADGYLGADCNSFVASYVMRCAPAHFHGTERSIDAYRNRRTLRLTVNDVRPGDLMIWGTDDEHHTSNAHIAVIGECAVAGRVANLALAQAAMDNHVCGIDYRREFVLEPNPAGNPEAAIPNVFRLRPGAMAGGRVDVYGLLR